MIKKNQHVVPVGTKWGVKGEGNSRYTKVTDIGIAIRVGYIH